MMIGFPSMTVCFGPRHYPSIPKKLEEEIIILLVKDNLLNDPVNKAWWWDPLRCNPHQRPTLLPAHITVKYPARDFGPPEIIYHDTVPQALYSAPRSPA